METLKQFHGLPCNCYTRRVLLGLLPDPNADSCPAICSAETPIVGVSSAYTVDGWYLEESLSNLVYMVSGSITQTVPCSSGLADYGHDNGNQFNGYEYPHIYDTLNNYWIPLMEVKVTLSSGTEFRCEVHVSWGFLDNSSTGVFQTSIDNGSTWQDTISFNINAGVPDVTFDIGTTNFIYRTVVTDFVTECEFFNPSEIGWAAICPTIDPSVYDYAIGSAEIVDGNWTIYPSGSIPSTSTATVQGSIDTGSTWFNITSPLPYNFFDGSNGVPTGQSALYTRLLVTDQYGCESYSVESTVTG